MEKDKKKWEVADYNLFEYFWSNSIFSAKDEKNLPYFLKKIDLFEDLSELEIFDLVQYMHLRNFSAGEDVFTENDYGIGFYLVVSGSVELSASNSKGSNTVKLYPKMYFGERNLLLGRSKSNVSVSAREKCLLAAILTPDLDNMIAKKPRVAVKFIKTLSKISLSRFEEIEKRLSNTVEGS